MSPTPPATPATSRASRDSVVIRFAGDSGDGMQLTGSQFTAASTLAGNDTATFPDFPAEIRAPAGTLAGVSGFQLHFASNEIFTPGDAVDVLVAMNPAALAKNIDSLKAHGILVVNRDGFSAKTLRMAGYEANPLDDGSLDAYQLFAVDLGRLTTDALVDSDLTAKEVARCKNFFALGLMSWLYDRPRDAMIEMIETRFGAVPRYANANIAVYKAGYDFGENSDQFRIRYEVPKATIAPGHYRSIAGNEAIAMGFVAAGQQAGKEIFYGSYPITPASDVLHFMSKQKAFGVRTFQAEDEIAAICGAIGASFGNMLAITATSGPGLALKSEALGLAVMAELPLVVLNVQRGGPSTGLPTKTEQSDLMFSIWGRNGESPVPVIAARSPGDAFWAAYEACKVALERMIPVILLSDGSIANGAEPWPVPDVSALPTITTRELDSAEGLGEAGFQPYARDPQTLGRSWPVLGTPGLEHRLGGLEKWDVTGHISYDPDNHHHMTQLRQARVDRIAEMLPPTEVIGERTGDVLVVGWGGTWGANLTAVRALQAEGQRVSMVHLRWLNPLPRDLGEIIAGFETVLVPEINNGQLVRVLRERLLCDAHGYNRVGGQPLRVTELRAAIEARIHAVRAAA